MKLIERGPEREVTKLISEYNFLTFVSKKSKIKVVGFERGSRGRMVGTFAVSGGAGVQSNSQGNDIDFE